MADTTLTIPIFAALDDELERVAHATGHTKADVALEALVEWFEDQSDVVSAQEVVDRHEPTTGLAEMRREFGLER